MPAIRPACLAIVLAAALPVAPLALAAAPLCPAIWPAQPAAYVAHINDVNRSLGIPSDYAARHHLVPLPQPTTAELVQVPRDVYGREQRMAAPAAAALKRMFAAAARDGVKLQTVSGYRSIAYQTRLIREKLQRGMSIQKALEINAVPGYSEHQTGCAMDISTPGYEAADVSFDKSKAFAWLQQHAATYGFHLSFPQDNRYGYEYEPWHWRYIAGSAPARSYESVRGSSGR